MRLESVVPAKAGTQVFRAIASAFALTLSATALAQPFPTKPVEIVNAFAPGGANDLNVRALQAAADRFLGQPLVQIFKQGGGGIVGTTEVATASPDGVLPSYPTVIFLVMTS